MIIIICNTKNQNFRISRPHHVPNLSLICTTKYKEHKKKFRKAKKKAGSVCIDIESTTLPSRISQHIPTHIKHHTKPTPQRYSTTQKLAWENEEKENPRTRDIVSHLSFFPKTTQRKEGKETDPNHAWGNTEDEKLTLDARTRMKLRYRKNENINLLCEIAKLP